MRLVGQQRRGVGARSYEAGADGAEERAVVEDVAGRKAIGGKAALAPAVRARFVLFLCTCEDGGKASSDRARSPCPGGSENKVALAGSLCASRRRCSRRLLMSKPSVATAVRSPAERCPHRRSTPCRVLPNKRRRALRHAHAARLGAPAVLPREFALWVGPHLHRGCCRAT